MPASMTQLFIHYVWGTWRRYPWLTGDVHDVTYRSIIAKCKQADSQVLALNGVADHVHLLVKISPTISIAKLIADIKGASSYIANHQGHDEVFKWQEGYGAFTVSPTSLQKIINYIRNQQAHHSSDVCETIITADQHDGGASA